MSVSLAMLAVYSLGFVLLYYLSLPRPFPDIPYNKFAAWSAIGDLPSLLRCDRDGKDIVQWMWQQCRVHRSPIFQIFIAPLQRPMLVVVDFKETKDVMFRRTPHEFDRSPMDKDFISGIAPHFSAAMQTHAQFKTQRRIFQDLMTPTFLTSVAASTIRRSTIDLVSLWREKSRLANGCAFQVDHDLKAVTFDAIWGVSFGMNSNSLATYIDLLAKTDDDSIPYSKSCDSDVATTMPGAPPSSLFDSFKTILQSLDMLRGSPIPKYKHLYLRQFKSYRSAEKIKNDVINKALTAASDTSTNAMQQDPKSALGYILRSEQRLLDKSGSRIPDAALKDELFGFLIAGYETSANSLGWTLKHLAEHQDIQAKLRESMSFLSESGEHRDLLSRPIRAPSADQMSTSAIPYLDAVLEEALYHAQTVPLLMRCAVKDTSVMGFHVPAGTNVFFLHNGNFQPPYEDAKYGQVKAGNDSTKAEGYPNFNPDRWLTRNEKTGELEFDPNAAKHLPFSGGVRGCFGRRLAYLQMRIVLALIILNFELDRPPPPFDDFEGTLGITRFAKKCYVRAKPIF